MFGLVPRAARSLIAAVLMSGAAHGAFLELADVVHLDVGAKHACALTGAGAVRCWGHNGNGELGDGTRTRRAWAADVAGFSSGAVAIAVSHGWEERTLASHSCAIATSGQVKCWGSNESGQLGTGMTSASLLAPENEVVGLGGPATAIAAGWRHTCALLTGGAVKCWGANEKGQLGDGTNTQRSIATDVVGLTGGVVEISAGAMHTCALTSLATVKCWGEYEPLGNGALGATNRPVDVPGLSGAAAVSAGGTARHLCMISGSTVTCEKSTIGYHDGGGHACSVTAAGGAKCWGNNEHGQLGDGTIQPRASAIDVVGLTSGVVGVSAGGWSLPPGTPCLIGACPPGGPVGYTCAAMVTGVAKCWGRNYCRALGSGTPARCENFVSPTTPVEVEGLAGVEKVAAGGEFACAVIRGGTVRCWGLGYGSAALPVFFSTSSQETVTLPVHPGASRLSAISTRANVLTGDEVMIAGFVVAGTESKAVMVRATGPALVASGITEPVANPKLTIVRASDQAVVAVSDDWITEPGAEQLQLSGRAPATSAETTLVMSLAPGGYTAIVSGADGGTGVGLVDVYEVNQYAEGESLSGISTRARVQASDKVMIAGFAISGSSRKVIVRARGPSLASEGVAGTLGNPVLRLVRASDQAIVATNDDWRNAPNVSEIAASGFAPAHANESAILLTLEVGLYTAIVSGAAGDSGVAIVEVYSLPW